MNCRHIHIHLFFELLLVKDKFDETKPPRDYEVPFVSKPISKSMFVNRSMFAM